MMIRRLPEAVRAIVLVILSLIAAGCGGFVPIEAPSSQPVRIAIDSANPTDPSAPRFARVTKLRGMTLPSSAAIDVYYPDDATERLPVALLLVGFNVSKPNYQMVASHVAAYGFVVVVPNHYGLLGFGLAAEVEEVPATLEFARTRNADPTSPLFDRMDADKLVLLGHSYGGGAALNAAAGRCVPPYCLGIYPRPPQLLGVAVYGADLRMFVLGGPIPRIDNIVPVALIRGDLDGIAPPFDTGRTFDAIQSTPKALITIEGANHFGMTDVVSPVGIIADPNAPTITQSNATQAVAQFSALFLKAFALNDPEARTLLTTANQSESSIKSTANVTIELQTEPTN